MNHDEEGGEERLVAMAVAEAAGRGPDDLEQRVLRRLGAEAVAPRRAPRAWLAAAALLLGGTAVVVAVAVATRAGDGGATSAAPRTQDPQPGKPVAPAPRITDANVPKLADYAFDDRPAIDCIAEIAKAAELPFASAVLEQTVTLRFRGFTPRRALVRVAEAAGAHVEQHGAVLAVVPGAVPPEGTVTLRCEATPIHELLALVVEQAHLNLVIAGSVTGEVAVDVTDCPARDLVPLLVDAVGAQVVGRGTVLAVVGKSQVPPPRQYFAYDRIELAKVLFAIGKMGGVAVQSDGDFPGRVSMRTKNQVSLDVLQAIAATQQCEIGQQDGKPIWRKTDAAAVARGWPPVGKASGAFELERALALVAAPQTFTTQCPLDGTVWLFCAAAPRRHVLAALAAVAGGHVEPREETVEFVR